MSKPWFRMYTEFATDPVVQSLAFDDQRHYVVLLCLKGGGVLDRKIPRSNRERIILRGLGLSEESGAEAKRRLMEVLLIDDNWHPLAWDKRQYESDISTKRVRKYRKTKETGNVSETFQNRSGNGPDTDTEEGSSLRSDLTPATLRSAVVANTVQSDSPEAASEIPLNGKKRQPIRYQQVIDLYHEILPELPPVEKLDKTLRAQIAQRMREKDIEDLDDWRGFFKAVRGRDFLMGRVDGTNGRPPYRTNLRLMTKNSEYIKILEGHYR